MINLTTPSTSITAYSWYCPSYLNLYSHFTDIKQSILEEHGIPDDFKYLAVIESGLSQVVSPAGAAGFWQFMKGTAPQFGLRVSSETDERYHVEKSTHAACAYLLEAREAFGSWALAAASYNMGMAGVRRELEEQGRLNREPHFQA